MVLAESGWILFVDREKPIIGGSREAIGTRINDRARLI